MHACVQEILIKCDEISIQTSSLYLLKNLTSLLVTLMTALTPEQNASEIYGYLLVLLIDFFCVFANIK